MQFHESFRRRHDRVPRYSKFDAAPRFQEHAGGAAAVKTVIDFLVPPTNKTATINHLAAQREIWRYAESGGQDHAGITRAANSYRLRAWPSNWAGVDDLNALAQLDRALSRAPFLTLVHEGFAVGNPLKLVVIVGMSAYHVYYHDTDKESDELECKISHKDFLRGWSRRVVLLGKA